MFQRSQEKYRVKYTTYLRDGDIKTFKNIFNINQYGNNTIVMKKNVLSISEKEWAYINEILRKERKVSMEKEKEHLLANL